MTRFARTWSAVSLALALIAYTPALAAQEEGDDSDRAEAEEASSASPDESAEESDSDDEETDSDDDAASIVKDALKANSLEFESGRAELTLRVEGDGGDSSTRKMVVKSAEIDGSVRTRIQLTHPDDVEGQAFLFAENPDGSDDVWMYVPAFSVTRRIEGSKKQGSFLGSHFTYNDLESRSLESGNYDEQGDSSIGKHEVHVIEATPDEGTDSAYGKVVAYIRKSDRVPLKLEFFDEEDELVKTLFVEKVATTDSGTTYIKQMRMQSEAGGYSRITIDSVEESADFPDSMFNKEQLGE